MEWPHKYIFPPYTQSTVSSTPTYLLPDSSDRLPAFSIRLGWGGVGVVTIPPLRTSAPSVISIFPTKVTTLSATESCAVPVVLSLQVSGTVSPAPFPVYPWDPRYLLPLKMFFLDGYMKSLPTLM